MLPTRASAILATSLLATSLIAAALPAARAEQPTTTKTTDSTIQAHMEVVGSDQKHVGTVDKYDGTTITLTKDDPAAKGEHHALPASWVGAVHGNTVMLSKTAQEAMARWQDAGRPGGDAAKR